MKIAICCSLKFLDEIDRAKAVLERKGHSVLIPYSAERKEGKDFWSRLKAEDENKFAMMKGDRMLGHFEKIKSADAILVLNYDKDGKRNYIGPNTLMEIAIAFEHGKKIYILNQLADEQYSEEVIACKPVFLGG